MTMRRMAVAVAVLAGLAAAPPARADGLYLKLRSECGPCPLDRPVTLRLSAVATRTFTLPGAPEVLIDEGRGFRPPTEAVTVLAAGSAPARVTPDAALTLTRDLRFARPGSYRVRLRYKLDGRVRESNAVRVEVSAAQASR